MIFEVSTVDLFVLVGYSVVLNFSECRKYR